MGYQVGNTCYATKELAENVYFSQVPPMITVYGVTQVNYTNGKWYYGSQQLTANLPECSLEENFKLGTEMGWLVFGIMALLYTFHIIKGLLK